MVQVELRDGEPAIAKEIVSADQGEIRALIARIKGRKNVTSISTATPKQIETALHRLSSQNRRGLARELRQLSKRH